MPIVPFKTPADYFVEGLGRNPSNMNRWKTIYFKEICWNTKGYDADLHVYPYIAAYPAMLSMGCTNKCEFCPSAKIHNGKVHYGDYERIISDWHDCNIHFMDEDFFKHPELDKILPLLLKNNIIWLAMSTGTNTSEVIRQYGAEYLYKCGLRCVEVGLESSIYFKVNQPIESKGLFEIYYLNMTFLQGETIKSMRDTAEWMKSRSLKKPIHFDNGMYYSPGQYLFKEKEMEDCGVYFDPPEARTMPTYIPYSFLDCEYQIIDLSKVNYYSKLMYGLKMYPEKKYGLVGEFISDYKDAMWLAAGIRCGGIV